MTPGPLPKKRGIVHHFFAEFFADVKKSLKETLIEAAWDNAWWVTIVVFVLIFAVAFVGFTSLRHTNVPPVDPVVVAQEKQKFEANEITRKQKMTDCLRDQMDYNKVHNVPGGVGRGSGICSAYYSKNYYNDKMEPVAVPPPASLPVQPEWTPQELHDRLVAEIGNKATDVIRMEACRFLWNKRRKDFAKLGDFSIPEIGKLAVTVNIGNVRGEKLSYSIEKDINLNICGWVFNPINEDGTDKLQTPGSLATAGEDISNVSDPETLENSKATRKQDFFQALTDFATAADSEALAESDPKPSSDQILRSILPTTHFPDVALNPDEMAQWKAFFGAHSAAVLALRKQVISEVKAFNPY